MSRLNSIFHINTFQRYLNAIAYTSIALFTVLLNFRQLSDRVYPNDIISWVLPASAILRGLGAPYVNYWDIKPPGLLLMTTIWGTVSTSIGWFHVLNMVLVASILVMYWHVLNRLISSLSSLILLGLTCLIFLSSTIHSQFLPSEINGLFWSLLGLTILTGRGSVYKKLFWSTFAFGLAGQMKEVFAFSIVSVIPLIATLSLISWKRTFKAILSAVGGLGLSLLIIVGFLGVTGSITGYQQVMSVKSAAFSLTDVDSVFHTINLYRAAQFPKYRFIRSPYNFLVMTTIGVVSSWLYLTAKRKASLALPRRKPPQLVLELQPHWLISLTIVAYWLGMWFGYAMQNRFGSVYDLSVLFSTFMIVALLAKAISLGSLALMEQFSQLNPLTKKPWFASAIMTIVLLGLTIPHPAFITEAWRTVRSFNPRIYVQRWQALESSDLIAAETAIKNGTEASECIQAVYGWAIGRVYYYAERQPCARHFIPNIITKEYIHEYRTSLVNNPPQALYYTLAGSDLNTDTFERDYFNYTAVLDTCYQVDTNYPQVYWPKPGLDTSTKLQHCLEETLTGAGQWPL